MVKFFLSTVISLLVLSVYGQTGPGGIGDTLGTSSLKLWLKADVGTSTSIDGEGVSTWLDQSGSGHNVFNTDTIHDPVYMTTGANAMPYLDFDGTNDFLEMSNPDSAFATTETTVFFVAEGAWTGAAFSIAASGITQEMLLLNRMVYHHTSSGNFTSKGHQCMVTIPPSSVVLMRAVFGQAPSDIALAVNALESNLLNNGASTPVDYTNVNRLVRIGRRASGEHFTGKVYEVIVYDRKLSASEISSVEEYLRCKYDIQNNNCGLLNTGACMTNVESVDMAASMVTISPNPAHQVLNITTELELDAYQITNAMGQVVQAASITTRQQEIGIADLPQGIYFLQMQTSNHRQVVKKFIKQ